MYKRLFAFLFLLMFFNCYQNNKALDNSLNTFRLDPIDLNSVKERIVAKDPEYIPAFNALLADADAALECPDLTVINKSIVPPSGDKHDFMSYGPYWWPDPEKPDGLPFIRRDGEVNPASRDSRSDAPTLNKLINTVETLALAAFFSDNDIYAEKAAHLLRVFFLDDSTRMNPHLEFGQAIPGRVKGRGIGIIGTRNLMNCIDAICMLKTTKVWTAKDDAGMQAWFKNYLDWLLNSDKGKDEHYYFNNHGTWWDVQAVSMALYTGQDSLAIAILEEAKERRIAKHIEPDGSQPHELDRTKSYSYSVMNLRGMFELASMGDKVGVDLWNYSQDGRSMRKAMDYLLRPLNGGPWKFEQLGGIEHYIDTNAEGLFLLLRRSANVWNAPYYEQMTGKLKLNKEMRTHLLFPKRRQG